MIDYRIYFMKSNRKCIPKTFKLALKNPRAKETIVITKRHSFKSITTRKHYTGRHEVELIVNGDAVAKQEFVYEGT